MTNHVSNLDPPFKSAKSKRRTSVMVKKELIQGSHLGRAMRMGLAGT